MRRRAREFDVVLHQHAVMQHGHSGGAKEFSSAVEARAMKNDVVTLPLARRTRGVDQRRILAVNGGRLTICIGLVFVGIQDLNFIQAHQKNTTVAAPLAFALGRDRLGKFDV